MLLCKLLESTLKLNKIKNNVHLSIQDEEYRTNPQSHHCHHVPIGKDLLRLGTHIADVHQLKIPEYSEYNKGYCQDHAIMRGQCGIQTIYNNGCAGCNCDKMIEHFYGVALVDTPIFTCFPSAHFHHL